MDDRNLRGADQLGEIEPTTEDEQRAAALTVCRHATGGQDAAELLAMLGLTAVPRRGRVATPCRKCRRPMSTVDCVGHARPASDGMCGSCYQATRRAPVTGAHWVTAVRDIETPLGVLPAGAEVIGSEVPAGYRIAIPGSRRRINVPADAVRPAKVRA